MKLASSSPTLSLNKHHALVVRVGEKRIMHIYIQRTHELLAELKILEESEKGVNGNRKMTRKKGERRQDGIDRIYVEP